MSILYIQQLPEPDNPSHSSLNSLFYGDIVSRTVKNGIQFGKVLYPCHIPPDCDYDLETLLTRGCGKMDVMWLHTGHVETVSSDDNNVILHYRHFVPGMRAKKKHTGNYGRVQSVKHEFAVRIIGTDQVIKHIDPDCLVPLKKCNIGDYVQFYEWIGVVTSINFEADLTVFDDEQLQCSFTWEETPEDSLEPSKTNSLRQRIKYPGQILNMSYREAMKDLQWPCHSIFYGPWRAWQHGELVVKVQTLVPTYTIEWLNRIPCSFHHQTDKPSNQVEDLNPNLLLFQRKPTSHIEIGTFWNLRSSDPSSWEYSNLAEWQSRFMEDSEKVTGPQNEHTSVELWDMLRSVNSTMGINPKDLGDNSGLVVEILSFESWVTLVDPFKGNNISYVKSTELEPLLLTGPDDILPLGTVVTEANGPSSLAYYGVVSAFDDLGPAMWINWFKFEDYKLNYLGRTSVSPNGDGVIPHPDFRLQAGQILYSPEPIPLDSLRSLTGILEKVGDDGLLHVRDPQNQMHKVHLHSMKPFPWRLSYDLGESAWRLTHTKRQAHVCLSGFNGESFSPALELIAAGSWESFPSISRFLRECRQSSMPQMSYSEFDVEVKNFHSLEATIADLRLYTGNMEPKIYLKFAVAAANQIHAVIEGPKDSLYEDFLLFFTIDLPPSFPVDPPVFHYHSFSTGPVNPCFKTNGEVLFPLLNTYPKFPGLHQERWDFEEHSLGLVLAAIQKILLCAVPYQHELKFPLLKLISSAMTNRKCLEANERYVENIIESVSNQLRHPLDCWKEETLTYYKVHLPRLHNRLVTSINRGTCKDCITNIPLPAMKLAQKHRLLRELRNLTCLYKDLFG